MSERGGCCEEGTEGAGGGGGGAGAFGLDCFDLRVFLGLRGRMSVLAIVFVGQREVFVCLGFVSLFFTLFPFSLGREAHRSANGVPIPPPAIPCIPRSVGQGHNRNHGKKHKLYDGQTSFYSSSYGR